MDTCDSTSKLVETTYKNIVEELGPCIKQLVVVGKIYLKSVHGMVAACRNYNNALSKVATMADNSTLRGSSDLGSALHHLVDINKEMIAQQTNIMKSLEFDFLAAMETAADKDTKLVEKEQKRFQQMQRRQKDSLEKCISTLKKSRRKKTINTDKQLAQMKLLENAKVRLDNFCEESLKEAIIQERKMYGTILERQCALNKQCLIYHNKGCELFQDNIPHWESLADTSDVLPDNCFPLRATPSYENTEFNISTIEDLYQLESPPVPRKPMRIQEKDRESPKSATMHRRRSDHEGIYPGTILRAKSEYNLSSGTHSVRSLKNPGTPPPPRFSRIFEYNGEVTKNFARALYPYSTNNPNEMNIEEGDIIEFIGEEDSTGWLFGENLMSQRSGWFPLSYTEPVKNGHDTRKSPLLPRGNNDSKAYSYKSSQRPLPPAPPPEGDYVSSKSYTGHHYQMDPSDYGTLKRIAAQSLLPVASPTLPSRSSHFEDVYQRTLTHRRENSRHNQQEKGRPKTIATDGLYYNYPIQSMHL